MQEAINVIKKEFQQQIHQADSSQLLEAIKVKYLGRKGPIQDLMKLLRDVAPEERPGAGKLINDLKEEIVREIDLKQETLVQAEEKIKLENEKIDVTLPGRKRFLGSKHPITQAIDEIVDILVGMGFSVQYGPDIDSDYYNYEALNFPPDHPARDMQDTIYITPNLLLRSHTSNVQTRVMESQKPPIRIIAPGKAYRNETITARSHVFFHQIEGLYVDEGVSFSDLLATLKEFLTKLFKEEVVMRSRPSYFPFVEPGLEVDIKCLICGGSGCQLCKHSGWLEVLGAGMVHPEVLRFGGIDPEKYTGYAWGMGIERMLLLKRGINDIRNFSQNNLRFLSQFPSA